MNIHQYQPNQALDTLIRKIQERDVRLDINLAVLVRDAIDEGEENILTIESDTIGRSKNSHEYRKIAPFSPEEALQVALGVLRACFVEQPLLMNEVINYFTDASEDHDVSEIQIDLQTETQIEGEDSHEFTLIQIPDEAIEEQRRNLDSLKEFITFSGE